MAEFSGQVVDLNGTEVKPGDKIAAAFRLGNVAVLRVGTILAFTERANKLALRVQWARESAGVRKGGRDVTSIGAIEADLTRFVKIQG